MADLVDDGVGGDARSRVDAVGSLATQGLAEVLGFAIAFVVMIVAFGAVVAAFIPLITGIVGVGITVLALTLSTEFMSVNQAANRPAN